MIGTMKFLMHHPLNADGRARALGRLLRWQIGTRLLPVPHLMPFVDNTVLVMERHMTGATGNWYCGLHEHADMAFVLHALDPDDLFVDIGANIGSYTVLASGVVGARTVALEPVPATFERLSRNISANNMAARVTALNIGLGSSEDRLTFSSENDTTNRVIEHYTNEPTIEVTVRRLDDVLEGAVPRIVKLDVEGWESEVLRGMPVTLADPALVAIITETNGSGTLYSNQNSDDVARVMHEHGFTGCSYDPHERKLVVGGTTHNTIFVRNMEFLTQRLARERTFRLVNGTI